LFSGKINWFITKFDHIRWACRNHIKWLLALSVSKLHNWIIESYVSSDKGKYATAWHRYYSCEEWRMAAIIRDM